MNKHSSLFGPFISYGEKRFVAIDPACCSFSFYVIHENLYQDFQFLSKTLQNQKYEPTAKKCFCIFSLTALVAGLEPPLLDL
jgi:hypothetical protein